MAVVGQTVTIVNKSGKIVKSTKHLVNVFNEAKSAYNERKAEIKALRDRESSDATLGEKERLMHKQVEVLTIQDEDEARSTTSSRRHSEDGGSRSIRRKPVPDQTKRRPPMERGVSDSFYVNDRPSEQRRHPRTTAHRPSPLRHDSHRSVDDDEPQIKELQRRHTSGLELAQHGKHKKTRSASLDGIDMDLAYGELPPPLPARRYDDEVELRSKMSGLQRLLDECNCVQHSVTATIDNLQKNPEALAAVALTLGEISNIAMKMAPGALTAMKSSFPAIVALLASPQFAIAAGVGVGVTIIALGGYKIIKKIKAKNEEARLLEEDGSGRQQQKQIADVTSAEEIEELREIDHIERWRRGIADAEADSLGTSVDHELITNAAARTLVEEGKLTEADFKPATSESGRSSARRRKHSKAKSTVSSRSRHRSNGEKATARKGKEKEPSGLKMLFMGRSG